jgi:hypothetical protein
MIVPQVSVDPVVVEEILIGTIGAIAALVGAIAVMKAALPAKGTITRSEERMHSVAAGRLSMIVAAQDRTSDPLNLRFTVPDPAVTLLRIELANQLDKRAGTAQCVKEAPRVFVATVEPKVVQRWYNANPYWDGETKQLPIRVSFITNGQAGCQTVWAAMSARTMPSSGLPDVSDFEWFLKGPCSKAHPTLAPISSRTRTERS